MSRCTVEQLPRFFVSLMVLLAIVLATNPPIHAGNGTFQSGAFNFCVSVRFNATAAQLGQIRTALQNGSDVLLDATDGQHRFGQITIVNDSGASQSSEYWVNSGSGRAYATFGRYGFRGEHVNLFFDSDFQASSGADGDAYTVAHEHAHHAYGVADEYSGPSGAAEDASPPDTATLNYSLMDNYFTRGGRASGTNYTLNEFCVATNHDPDGDTWQENRHGESTWETIAGQTRFPAAAPAALPVDAPPASQSVTFVDGFGGLRVMLLLDQSGSMSLEQRLEFAQAGANTFINFIRVGDGLGVASFSSLPSVNFPLTTVVDGNTTAAARAAVNSLFASGATNIGDGLLTALGQMTAQTNRSCNEIIVLLSDGDHNTGTPPSAAIPQLQAERVTVLSVGVGTGISTSGQATLQDIATQTGGRFFRVASPFDLIGLFLRLAFESIGGGLLTRAPETIATGEVKEIPALVEAGTERATFAVTFADSTDDLTLSLRTPSGAIITDADAVSNPDIDVIIEPNSLIFQIRNPEAGTWSIIISAGTISTGTIEVLAFAEHEGVQLNVGVEKNALLFPDAIEIHATPTFGGENVVGARVEGIVIRPDGSQVPITLHDDGLAGHADVMPSDGIYSALFNNYSEDGTYTVELTVTTSNGITYAGEALFQSEPSNEKPVPAFTRMASTTAVVTGIPTTIPRNLGITFARVEPDKGHFRVDGSFSLDATSDGIDILNEEVIVTFGGFSQTIPAGSFIAGNDLGSFRFKGTNQGIRRIDIRDHGTFSLIVRNVDLGSTDFSNPVPLSLQIGNDRGETTIPFDDRGRFPGD